MTKNFNWNYRAPHILGQSKVADDKQSAWATFTGLPDELDQPMPRAKRTHELTNSEWENQQ